MDNLDSILGQMADGGLLVEQIQTGSLQRCRTVDDRVGEKSGWYVVHEIPTRRGGTIGVGVWGNWKEGGSHRIELRGVGLDPEERAAIRTRISDDRRRSEGKRRALSAKAALRAERAWRGCSSSGDCDYLTRKSVKPFGVRFSVKGNLLVPVTDTLARMRGLQIIYGSSVAKSLKGRDKDFWPAGMEKKGGMHLIGTPIDVLLVAEGYATAATLHEATGLPVACVFDAGNMLPAVQALHKRYRGVQLLICGDDDYLQRCKACGEKTMVADEKCSSCGAEHGQNNPGVRAATNAALAVNGGSVFPRFSDRGNRKITDFNDLHQAEGLHLVRQQVEEKISELGWDAASRATHNTQGLRGAADFLFDLDVLIEDYALIYSTETVFDELRRRIISLSGLRAAAGRSLVRMWSEHPDRRTVLPESVVFDPGGDPSDDSVCNLWGGWPTKPRAGCCELTLELLEFLCSGDENPRTLYQWLLKWLAFPLQNPGAKMQTALLMHGTEGSGKNMFFGAIRKIYREYGAIISQSELESQFNGWASRKLFIIGNEVVTRAELYHHQGRLKNMITEPEWMINEKNLPLRQEANHVNFCFFSNRLDIAKLDRDDRRYCVVYTPEKMPKDVYGDIKNELDNGGVESLHDHLLNLDLGDFEAHTEPPMTRAKSELIELSMDSTERFWSEWTSNSLPVPCIPIKTRILYHAYRYWATQIGVPRSAPEYVLNGMLRKKPRTSVRRCRYYGSGGKHAISTVIWPNGAEVPPGTASSPQWLTEQFNHFQFALNDWRQEIDG